MQINAMKMMNRMRFVGDMMCQQRQGLVGHEEETRVGEANFLRDLQKELRATLGLENGAGNIRIYNPDSLPSAD